MWAGWGVTLACCDGDDVYVEKFTGEHDEQCRGPTEYEYKGDKLRVRTGVAKAA